MSADPSQMDFSGGDSGGDLSPIIPTAQYITGDNSGGPSASDIANATSGSGSVQANVSPDAPSALNIPSAQGSSGSSSGAIGSLLNSLGLSGPGASSTLAILSAALTAAGKYQANKQYAPKQIPGGTLFGGQPGTLSAPVVGGPSTGFGPSGGYAKSNYPGSAPNSTGQGYAPLVQNTAPPLPSYYTYGQGPQQSYFSNTPSTLIAPTTLAPPPTGMAKGGHALMKKYAVGGPIMNTGIQPGVRVPPTSAPSIPMGPRSVPAMPQGQQQSPMASAMQAARPQTLQTSTRQPVIGHADGGAIAASRHIVGPGDGTSDSIPARLANGEYVFSADVVSSIGNGSNGAGAKKLDQMVHNIRVHKSGNMSKGKLPADAKPLDKYLGGSV